MDNKIEKFSNKSEDYDKYRPSYPISILDNLKEYDFSKSSIIADIGSGTGK
jgi:tRNA G46 methylase TrmB